MPVPKPDGSVRMCVDYRRLNTVTVTDPYYMPTFNELLERIGTSRVLSKFDLSKGYYQVVVESDSIDKTAFISPFGKFGFRRMPFGLKNAPAVFQRLVEQVLQECRKFAAVCIDDIIVFSLS